MREKLISLLINSPGLEVLFGGEEEFAKNADWLIANDVVPVVRCKDCEYCEKAFDDYWCNYNWNYAPPSKPKLTRADGFCHNGERREGE